MINFSRAELPDFFVNYTLEDPVLCYYCRDTPKEVRVETEKNSYVCHLDKRTVRKAPRYNLPSNEDKAYRLHVIKTICLKEES